MEKIKDFTTKHRKLLYILAAAVIIIISCYFGFQEQDHWSSEKYGTTSDGQIGIDNNTEIKTSFTIEHDDFKGVLIRISNNTRKYNSEKLHFYLYDENYNLISDSIMNLQDELYNIDTFVPLNFDKSKGKKVYLYIYGEDINKVPYIYLSNKANLESVLYVNGKKRDEFLVMSSAYMKKEPINSTSFIGGGLFLLLLFIVFLWDKNREESYSENGGLIYAFSIKTRKVLNHIIKYKKLYWFFVLSFSYIVFTYFVYKTYIEETLIKQEQIQVVKDNKNADVIKLSKDNSVLVQNIILNKKEFSSFVYSIKVSNANNKAKINVKVFDKTNEYEYHNKTYSVSNLNDGYWRIFMNNEFTNSNNCTAKIVLELIDAEDTNIDFISGNSGSKSTSFLNGEQLRVSPSIQVNYSDNGFLFVLYILLCGLIYAFIILSYYLFIIRKTTVENAFIPIALLLGIIYLFLIPIYTVPDEYVHIDSAYSVSNNILGIKNDELNKIYKRKCDDNTDLYVETHNRAYMYRPLVNLNLFQKDNVYLKESQYRNGFNNVERFYYYFAAIAITVARLIGLSTYCMLLMGRILNYLIFVLAAYKSIKVVPIGKGMLMTVVLIPIVLQEAVSFSYDCIVNAISILYFSYVVYYFKMKNKMKSSEMMFLLFLALQMSLNKGGVYLPLAFIISFSIICNIKKFSLMSIIIFVLPIVAYMKNNMAGILRRLFISQSNSISYYYGGELYTLSNLLKNPFLLFQIMLNTLFIKGSSYIHEMFGGKLGAMDIDIPWFVILLFILTIIYICRHENNQGIKKSMRFGIIVLSIASAILVCLSMLVSHTLFGDSYITGVQGRYFVPILVWILLVLIGENNIKKECNHVYFLYCLNQMIVIFCVLMAVFAVG